MVWLYSTKVPIQCKTSYIDTDSFIVRIETEDIYGDIANDVEKRFEIYFYPWVKKEKVIGLMKDELCRMIMT